MDPHPRYEILGAIATGDFAVVYRGRDRELGREVAIKQIHQQFLFDPRQLDRYWQEAQLLAALEHPNIMTIYDIVRARGWLILELMQGNLQQLARGQPLDLNFLRAALTGALQGLAFLHANHVTHGDVKPSNLLLDRRNRIKLGDFGLARRAANDQGSLLKGATKYMAPELVSPQFGAIGPASDLYSLGFTIYELMCGTQFDTLFPGLEAFGRDRQIAWMMWHAAPDRRLPAIGRVLEGVPPDLAGVIEKLCQKPQELRYRTAEEALADLQARPDVVTADKRAENEAAEQAARATRRNRFVAVGAILLSMALSFALLFIPTGGTPPPPPAPEPVRGVLKNLIVEGARRQTIVLEDSESRRPREFDLGERDLVFLNDKPSIARALAVDDVLVIRILKDEQGNTVHEVRASRPAQDYGTIARLDMAEGRITLTVEHSGRQEELTVVASGSVPILFNGKKELAGRPPVLGDLREGDRLTVDHYQQNQDRIATRIAAQRVVSASGVIRRVDPSKGELSVALGSSQSAELETMKLAQNCEISLNGQRFVENRLLGLADLRPGDLVTYDHDTQFVRVSAERIIGETGRVTAVGLEPKSLEVALTGNGQAKTYLIAPDCDIQLAGVSVTIADLRRGDEVDVTHNSPDSKTPAAVRINAQRPSDPAKWAIIIGNQTHDDLTVPPLAHTARDAQLFSHALTDRYAVAPERVVSLVDESRIRLEQAIPQAIERAGAARQLIVYCVAHGYMDDMNAVYIAPKDFSLGRVATSGLALRWLVDQLEKSPAKEKLLILDLSHPGDIPANAPQPSTAEMTATVQGTKSARILRTVHVLASCDKGQRGLDWPDKQQGLFGYHLVEAFSGQADKNRDIYLEPTELHAYLRDAMAASPGAAEPQLPVLVLPDDTPPRLTEEAKQSIRQLAAILTQTPVDTTQAGMVFDEAQRHAPKEFEARQLYSLILLKARLHADAVSQQDELKSKAPGLLVPWMASGFTRFEKQDFAGGISDLTQLVSRLQVPKPDTPPAAAMRFGQTLEWIGRMREFAVAAGQEERRPAATLVAALDAAIARLGEDGEAAYAKGRQSVLAVAADFDRKILEAGGDPLALRLGVERKQMRNYVIFPYEAIAQDILASLDD
jgi:serine/threonine protein kinase